jgi:sulfur-carrier protein adenylyltransferase/sulfurtransferase
MPAPTPDPMVGLFASEEEPMPAELPDLTKEELQRYSRHLLLPEVGVEGQRRLRAARVLLIGAGGLGSPSALYLAAAGVGTIGLVDFDTVDVTNLQRQILHGTASIGRSKLESARERLHDLNPGVTIVPHSLRLDSSNALGVLSGYDVVVDGSDNFPTRYLANDACVLLGRPYVYGSIFRFDGQASVFAVPEFPCYRCLYPEPPPPGLVPTCAEGGVLGVLPGVIGSIQALEAIKLILGAGESLAGRLLLFDALRLRFRELRLRKDPECPVCGPHPTITSLIDYDAFCGIGSAAAEEIDAAALRREQASGGTLTLVDVREPHEWASGTIDGARLIPLAELASRSGQIDANASVVVYCQKGSRSRRGAELLRSAGFTDVRSLTGGIEAWRSSTNEKNG